MERADTWLIEELIEFFRVEKLGGGKLAIQGVLYMLTILPTGSGLVMY